MPNPNSQPQFRPWHPAQRCRVTSQFTIATLKWIWKETKRYFDRILRGLEAGQNLVWPIFTRQKSSWSLTERVSRLKLNWTTIAWGNLTETTFLSTTQDLNKGNWGLRFAGAEPTATERGELKSSNHGGTGATRESGRGCVRAITRWVAKPGGTETRTSTDPV